jgi:hypothetical protein
VTDKGKPLLEVETIQITQITHLNMAISAFRIEK